MKYRIPQHTITEIIETVDIIDVISETILLKKVGRNFVGLCPFHTEKTPSFTVNSEKQVYYCFGCKEGGNVVSFLMKRDGISFLESISSIAIRFGIKLPELHSKKDAKQCGILTLSKINRDAMVFFHHSLLKLGSTHPVVSYLERRKIKDSTIKKFKLGYADEKWRSLERYLVNEKRWQKKMVDVSGLTVIKEGTGITYDRFRKRIIFPIYDMKNVVIGFGARVIDDSFPKYINSPKTPVYNKSDSLYGINIAREESRRKGFVFIVEGYLDLIMLYQSGIKNSVATLGTSITTKHIRQIKGMIGRAGKIILVYDSDQAGIKAVYRSLEIFYNEFVNVKIMLLPQGYDPDTYVVEFGAEKFIEESRKAVSALTFITDVEVNKNGFDVEGKIKTIDNLKLFMATNNNFLSRSLSIQYLADRINISSTIIQKEVDTQMNTRQRPINNAKRKLKFDRTYLLELEILAIILHFPTSNVIRLLEEKSIIKHFKNKSLRNIASLAIDMSKDGINCLNLVMEKCRNKKEKSIIANLVLLGEKWDESNFSVLIRQLEEERLRNYSKNITKKITEAQLNGDNHLINKLLKEKQLLYATRTINRNSNI